MSLEEDIYNSFLKLKRSGETISDLEFFLWKQDIYKDPKEFWDHDKVCELNFDELKGLVKQLKTKEIRQSYKTEWNLFLKNIIEDNEEINDNEANELLCLIYECEKNKQIKLSLYQRFINWLRYL